MANYPGIPEVDGLEDALDNKAPLVHGHAQSDITGLATQLNDLSQTATDALNNAGNAQNTADEALDIANANSSNKVDFNDYESGVGIDVGQWGDVLGLANYATTSAVAAGYVPRITSVDNRLTRFDGTTGAVQSSGITVDDSDNVTGVGTITAVGVTTSGSGSIAGTAYTASKWDRITATHFYGDAGTFSPDANGIRLPGTTRLIGWSSNSGLGAHDTSISRQSAGVIQIGTTDRNALGSLALTNLTASGNATVLQNLIVGDGVTNHGTLTVKNTGDDLLIVDNTDDGRLRLNATGPHGQFIQITPRDPLMGGVASIRSSNMAYIIGNAAINFVGSGTELIIRPESAQPVIIEPHTSYSKGLVVRGRSGQSVNLQEWHDSAGSVLASVSQSGNLTASGTGTFEGEMRYRPGSVRQVLLNNASTTVTGTGTSASQGGIGWRQRTGTTADSTSVASWRFYSRYNNSNTASGPIAGIAWNQPLRFSAVFTSGSSGFTSTGTHQIAFRSSTAGGALTTNGIGFERRSGSRLWLLVHNGTTSTEIDSGIDFLATRLNTVEVRSNGAGVVTLWLNNVQIATTSSGPTTIVNASENDLRSFLTTTDTFNQDVLINHIEVQGI